jgi:hypothetical protein
MKLDNNSVQCMADNVYSIGDDPIRLDVCYNVVYSLSCYDVYVNYNTFHALNNWIELT